MELDVDISDDESIFTTPDLEQLWEDITSVPGYNHPDVIATTKHKDENTSDNIQGLSPMEIRMNRQIREIKRLQK